MCGILDGSKQQMQGEKQEIEEQQPVDLYFTPRLSGESWWGWLEKPSENRFCHMLGGYLHLLGAR